ncbi:MAG: hypothetical protein JWM44_2017 [Bacilli bacterium]|jgi:hypothetical protein|nr:hypothetical protein [Bacilli bacterium]
MMEKLQAYFQREDEAIHVKNLLIKLDATKLEIALLEDNGSDDQLPLAVPVMTGGVTYVNNGILGAIPPVIVEDGLVQEQREEKFNIYRSFLSGEIAEEHYEEAIQLIQSNNGQFDIA